MDCVLIARRAWPEFKERESIYHLFCKFFSNTCFVCEDDRRMLAFLLGFVSQVDATQAYIHLVAVAPGSQRRGIASDLYNTFFSTVRQLGVSNVRLIVNPDNRSSLRFHEEMGFRRNVDGEEIQVGDVTAVRDYNGPGLHMVPFIRSVDERDA